MSYMSYNDDTWHSYALQLQLTWHSTWGLMTLAFFDQKLENFAIPRNTDIDCIWTHNSFNFFWVFKDFLIDMIGILMMSSKLAIVSLLKIKAFDTNVMTS